MIIKKILTTSCLSLWILSGAFSQKAISVSEMVKSKNFVFIVTNIENRNTYNGSVSTASDGYNSTPTVLNLQQRIGSQPYQADYLQIVNGDGDYFGDYRLRSQNTAPKYSGENVFLVQNADHILIREKEAPVNFNEIEATGFYEYLPEQYQVKLISKNDNKWVLTYELAVGRNRKEFKLEISESGKAILKALKDNNTKAYLYGYIIKPEDVKKL
jgi:hypothetical protein